VAGVLEVERAVEVGGERRAAEGEAAQATAQAAAHHRGAWEAEWPRLTRERQVRCLKNILKKLKMHFYREIVEDTLWKT